MNVKLDGLTFKYGKKNILDKIDLDIISGEILALLGPNGSGKTTLLKNISGVLKPENGAIFLDMQNLSQMTPREIARYIAVVEQEIKVGFHFTVREIVQMGRIPHSRPFQRMSTLDKEIVENAMQKTKILCFSERTIFSLSSGERQRVWLAMALAQMPKILLLDEPVSYLDIRYQIEICDLIQELASEGLSIVMTIHDLHLAAHYAHRIALLKSGRLVATGKPQELLTETTIWNIFDVHLKVMAQEGGIWIGFGRIQ